MYPQPNFNQFKKHKVSYKRMVVLSLILFSIYGVFKYGLSANYIEVDNGNTGLWNKVTGLFSTSSYKEKVVIKDDPDYKMPIPEKDRLDILILGIRGEDQEDASETGALLTDTIMIFSFDKETKKSSLVSIPRDLYVRTYEDKKDKINTIYEIGLLGRGGLDFTKKHFSKISGVYIDHIIVFDFSSFKKIIDDLDGIDISLEKPFIEKNQWGFEFSLPAGDNHLDGDNALYYVRSRFSTSDFDRANRQQQVINAIKIKISQLNIITDPIKTLSILNTLRSNIETDMDIFDVPAISSLAKEFNSTNSKMGKYVISTQNLVYEGKGPGNSYILLPAGDTLSQIKNLFTEIMKDKTEQSTNPSTGQ